MLNFLKKKKKKKRTANILHIKSKYQIIEIEVTFNSDFFPYSSIVILI